MKARRHRVAPLYRGIPCRASMQNDLSALRRSSHCGNNLVIFWLQTIERMFVYNKGMRRLYNWKEVQAYHDAGHCFMECQRRFGFTHTAWVKAIKRGELTARFRKDGAEVVDPDDRRRIYNWVEVQAYYDAGHTYRQCQAKFGFCAASWDKARKRGEIKTRPLGMPLDELMRRGKSRYNVKHRLLRSGLLKDECSVCGITHWRGRRLSLHIDHINGLRNDHRLHNLRMLCPNCHSQTETYGGRNARRNRGLQER